MLPNVALVRFGKEGEMMVNGKPRSAGSYRGRPQRNRSSRSRLKSSIRPDSVAGATVSHRIGTAPSMVPMASPESTARLHVSGQPSGQTLARTRRESRLLMASSPRAELRSCERMVVATPARSACGTGAARA